MLLQQANQLEVDGLHFADQPDVDLLAGGQAVRPPAGPSSSASLPESPTALPPWWLISPTISLLIFPTRTISTI